MAVESQLVAAEDLMEITDKKKRPNNFVLWRKLNWRALISELIATALLMLLGCMTCIPIDGVQSPMYGPLGFGLIVLLNIQIFGHISGAHMNPSVTLSAVIWKKMSITLGVAYILAQCVGAIIGYGVLVTLSPSEFLNKGICVTQPNLKYSALQGMGIEVFLTAALVLITCAVWDPINELKSESNSLKFGLTIAGLSLAGGPLTGASMNPARSLAPALWTNIWTSHWIYWAGPLLGATIAAIFYKNIWLQLESVTKSRQSNMD